jgi:hypothetical protein
MGRKLSWRRSAGPRKEQQAEQHPSARYSGDALRALRCVTSDPYRVNVIFHVRARDPPFLTQAIPSSYVSERDLNVPSVSAPVGRMVGRIEGSVGSMFSHPPETEATKQRQRPARRHARASARRGPPRLEGRAAGRRGRRTYWAHTSAAKPARTSAIVASVYRPDEGSIARAWDGTLYS